MQNFSRGPKPAAHGGKPQEARSFQNPEPQRTEQVREPARQVNPEPYQEEPVLTFEDMQQADVAPEVTQEQQVLPSPPVEKEELPVEAQEEEVEAGEEEMASREPSLCQLSKGEKISSAQEEEDEQMQE